MVTKTSRGSNCSTSFLGNNPFNIKAGMLFLEFFSAPCFIYKLKLIIKNLLFSKNNINMLVALLAVGHFNHSTTACEKLNKSRSLQVHQCQCKELCYLWKMLKDFELNLLYAEKTRKTKTSAQYYVTNNKFKPENFLTADDLNLLASLMSCSNLFT